MELILRVEIDFLMVIVLIIMYNDRRKGYSTRDALDSKIFNYLVISSAIILVLEACTWIFDGRISEYSFILNKTFVMMYYFFCMMPSFLCFLYTDCIIRNDNKNLVRHLPVYILPFVINAICAIINFNTGFIYTIDAHNVFTRGQYNFIPVILSSLYFIFAIFDTVCGVKNGDVRVKKDIRKYFSTLIIPPILGIIIQTFIYGLNTIWMGYLISTFFIFINTQNNRINTDGLTGVYNRKYFEIQLENMSKSASQKTKFFALMIDLDGFKAINDTFGHSIGDTVLKEFANILKDVCGIKYSISRFGGDEFVILGKCSEEKEPYFLIEKIFLAVQKFNKLKKLPIELKYSIGCSNYDGSISLSEFLNNADKKMYENKIRKTVIKKYS